MADNQKKYRIIRKFSPIVKKLLPKKIYAKLKKDIKKDIVYDPSKRIQYDTTYPFGINYFGHLKADIGLGEGSRLYGRAIAISGLPSVFIDVPLPKSIPQNNNFYNIELSNKPIYSINIFHINPENFYTLEMMFDQSMLDHRYNIGVFLWELDHIPQSWITYLDLFDAFIVPSNFIKEALTKVTDKPIDVINYGLTFPTLEKEEPIIDKCDKFTFLTMFDSKSNIKRKNVEGVIKAFKIATKSRNDARLIVKANNLSKKDKKSLLKAFDNNPNIELFDKSLSRNQVYQLISETDCLVSLHRAEGFGLTPLEAMMLSTSVIVTNYSSTTDFCNEDNAFLVDYSLVKSNVIYQDEKGFYWAEPDIKDASRKMIEVMDNKELRENKKKNAIEFLIHNLSVDICCSLWKKILENIPH